MGPLPKRIAGHTDVVDRIKNSIRGFSEGTNKQTKTVAGVREGAFLETEASSIDPEFIFICSHLAR